MIYNDKKQTKVKNCYYEPLDCEYKQQTIDLDSLQLKEPHDYQPINLSKRFQDYAMYDEWKCPKCDAI